MKFLTCKEMIFLLYIRKNWFWNIERNYRNLEIGPPSFLTIIDKNDIENDLIFKKFENYFWKIINAIWFDLILEICQFILIFLDLVIYIWDLKQYGNLKFSLPTYWIEKVTYQLEFFT